jgi:hypothetical protein
MAAAPTPFTLAVPDVALSDLRARLALTRLPGELSGAGRTRDPPVEDIARLVARWRGGYDWRRREAAINALPLFALPLAVAGHGELEVQFLHQRSKVEGAIPLLFVHGCTSSLHSTGWSWADLLIRAGALPRGGEDAPAAYGPVR